MASTEPISLFQLYQDVESKPGGKRLQNIVTSALEERATDIHIQKGRDVVLRTKGKLKKLPAGCGQDSISDEDYEAIKNLLGCTDDPNKTVIYRLPKQHVRTQLVKWGDGRNETLLLRIQNTLPPPLTETLKGFGRTIEGITQGAGGLTLVCGPIGAGKTTLAAAISLAWANNGKHILSIQDPVEYLTRSEAGELTHLSCELTPANPNESSSLNQCVAQAFRSDIDGLYIGEVRSANTLKVALDFSGAKEPVVTTIHAGSIPDGIMRCYNLATQLLEPNTAKLLLSQCLRYVIFTDLAYAPDGQPTPAILCLPVSGTDVKAIIAAMEPARFTTAINDALTAMNTETGAINWEAARKSLTDRRIDQSQIAKVLPDRKA